MRWNERVAYRVHQRVHLHGARARARADQRRPRYEQLHGPLQLACADGLAQALGLREKKLYLFMAQDPQIQRLVATGVLDWKDIIQNKEDPELVSPEKLRTAVARLTVITHLSNCDQFTFCKS
jgi:hypothetical protein